MPTFCYSDLEGGPVVERVYPLGKAPKSIVVEGERLLRDFGAESPRRFRYADPWATHESWTMGDIPDHNAANERYCAENGVPTKYSALGNPIVTSKTHQRKLLKLFGMVNKQSYY